MDQFEEYKRIQSQRYWQSHQNERMEQMEEQKNELSDEEIAKLLQEEEFKSTKKGEANPNYSLEQRLKQEEEQYEQLKKDEAIASMIQSSEEQDEESQRIIENNQRRNAVIDFVNRHPPREPQNSGPFPIWPRFRIDQRYNPRPYNDDENYLQLPFERDFNPFGRFHRDEDSIIHNERRRMFEEDEHNNQNDEYNYEFFSNLSEIIQPTVSSGASEEIISKLPTKLYENQLESNEVASCGVCLSEYEMGESLKILPLCSHYFHQNCIEKWLSINKVCPICRKNVMDSFK